MPINKGVFGVRRRYVYVYAYVHMYMYAPCRARRDAISLLEAFAAFAESESEPSPRVGAALCELRAEVRDLSRPSLKEVGVRKAKRKAAAPQETVRFPLKPSKRGFLQKAPLNTHLAEVFYALHSRMTCLGEEHTFFAICNGYLGPNAYCYHLILKQVA